MHKKAMLAVAVTVVVLFAAMTVQRHGIKTQLEVYGQRYENAEQNLDAEKDRTGKIDDEAEYMKTDEYVEGVARDHSGWCMRRRRCLLKDRGVRSRREIRDENWKSWPA